MKTFKELSEMNMEDIANIIDKEDTIYDTQLVSVIVQFKIAQYLEALAYKEIPISLGIPEDMKKIIQ